MRAGECAAVGAAAAALASRAKETTAAIPAAIKLRAARRAAKAAAEKKKRCAEDAGEEDDDSEEEAELPTENGPTAVPSPPLPSPPLIVKEEDELPGDSVRIDPLAETAARHAALQSAATCYIGRVRVTFSFELLPHPERVKKDVKKLTPKGGKPQHQTVAFVRAYKPAPSIPPPLPLSPGARPPPPLEGSGASDDESVRYVLRVAPYMVVTPDLDAGHGGGGGGGAAATASLEASLRFVAGGAAVLTTRWVPCAHRLARWQDSEGAPPVLEAAELALPRRTAEVPVRHPARFLAYQPSNYKRQHMAS